VKNHTELKKMCNAMGARLNILETFGKETFGFIEWKSIPQRQAGEVALEMDGFVVDKDYAICQPFSSVRVSTTKARKLKTFNRWTPYCIEDK
jgi:hypothetical protein